MNDPEYDYYATVDEGGDPIDATTTSPVLAGPVPAPPAASTTSATSTSIVGMVVIVLGVVGLAVVIGGLVLAYQGKAIPDALIALGSGAIGAVSALLARTSSTSSR